MMMRLFCNECQENYRVKAEDIARVKAHAPAQLKQIEGDLYHFNGGCFFKTNTRLKVAAKNNS